MINKIKAEIERLKKEEYNSGTFVEQVGITAFNKILSFIESLEKEPVQVSGFSIVGQESVSEGVESSAALEKEQEPKGFDKAYLQEKIDLATKNGSWREDECPHPCIQSNCMGCSIYEKKEQDVNFEKEEDWLFNHYGWECLEDMDTMVFARHFYELGLNSKTDAPKIKGWVARDENGELNLFRSKPYSDKSEGEHYWRSSDYSDFLGIDSSLFPEIDFYEPIEVELTFSRVKTE